MVQRYQTMLNATVGRERYRQLWNLTANHTAILARRTSATRPVRRRMNFSATHEIARRAYSRGLPRWQQVPSETAGTSATQSTAEKPSASASVRTVPMTFVEPDGTEKEVPAIVGSHLLDVAHANNVELEGACGGELACSTCHLIFEQHVYDTLPPKLDDEDDMLDLALALTPTSRLGCQIRVTDEFAGVKVKIPDDGF